MLIATLPATATSYPDLGLTPGTAYDYHVQAFNVSGFNDFAGVATETLCDAPAALQALGGGVITLAWAPSAGATSYNVYRSLNSGGERTALITGLAGTTDVDNDVTPGTTYYYVVAAVDNSGESAHSTEASAHTGTDVAPVVTGSNPYDGSFNQATTVPIVVTFDKPLDAATVTTAAFRLAVTPSGGVVRATVTYEPATDSVTVRPAYDLHTSTAYTLTVAGGPGGVADAAGTPLASDQAVSFTTTATPADAATFVGQAVPTTMTAGKTYAVSVSFRNTGTDAWAYDPTTKRGVRLGTQDPQDNLTWGPNRVAPAATVNPGSVATFTFTVTAPKTAGTHNFQWRMVDEYVQWFGDFSPAVAVTVT